MIPATRTCPPKFAVTTARFVSTLGMALLTLAGSSSVLAQTTTVNYPPPPPPGGTAKRPSVSFVPRPQDPPLSFDITTANANSANLPRSFAGIPLFVTQQVGTGSAAEDVIGPNGTITPLPGHPNFSTSGALFNNKLPAGAGVDTFTLIFDTPSGVDDIGFDTYLRTDDLQSFVLDGNGALIPTWNIDVSKFELNRANHWVVTFSENPDYPWGSALDGQTAFPAFSVLGSGFDPGSSIVFSYLPYSADVPEPGVISLAFGMLATGVGLRLRRKKSRG